MQKRALEISCYVAGAGAFGVFFRWLQDMIAFNELGLVDRSAFNVLVPLFVLAMAAVYLRFLSQDEKKHLALPEEFSAALGSDYRLYAVLSWLAAAVVVAGALALLAKSETDKFVKFLRVLSVMGALSGLSTALLMDQAARGQERPAPLCVLSLPPIVFFATWLIYTYRANSINSVLWAYVPEMVTVIAAMFAFARIAGFAFGTPNGKRARFDAMLGASLCIMSLADERHTGMQLMLAGTALQLMLYNWAMICNLKQSRPQPAAQPEDGFDRLG